MVLFFMGCSSKLPQNYKRIALVVANENYEGNRRLKTPIKGAEVLRQTLDTIGYEVISLDDATFKTLEEKLRIVEDKVKKHLQANYKTILYIYFAGHGHTQRNRTAEAFVELLANKYENKYVSNYYLYDKIKNIKSTYNIISIDACLDSVRKKHGKYVYGNAKYIPNNILLSYATGFTQKAEDSMNPHNINAYSYYTTSLIEQLQRAEKVSVQRVFNFIEREVKQKTHGLQTSFHFSTLDTKIVFPSTNHQPADFYPN